MNRRHFLYSAVALGLQSPLLAALRRESLDEAAMILTRAASSGQVTSAVLHVAQRDERFTRHFGRATSPDAMFLLGSITKPICVTALMTLFDRSEFSLDDRLQKFVPQFKEDGRGQITLRHLLTHTSGLPDQLAENDSLRRRHAGLNEFVEHALSTPLGFAPGARYQYSSMGILLAVHVAELISGKGILEFVDSALFRPLKMQRSALGAGRFALEDFEPVQTEHAAPEAGGGDPQAKDWDWNSRYWRELGAPWGGAHCSALDLEIFLNEFLHAQGTLLKPETSRLMVTNHNSTGMTPRGLGFGVGAAAGSKGCSERTFGHTGSTGTLCWADPATSTVCVVLTSLPGRAAQPHPRETTAAHVAAAAR